MQEPRNERDVNFLSDENHARDIVLGFIHDKDGKRIGMRVLHRDTNTVKAHEISGTWYTWNLNIHEGQLITKCCKLSDFPVLSLPAGVEGNPLDPGVKLVTRVSGAWVLEEVDEGKFRLVSVSGQMKDVSEETAINFHNNYKIANAVVVGNKLTGTFRKYEKDFGKDVFELFDDGRVHWIYYNPNGYGDEGQYVENTFDVALIREAAKNTKNAIEFFEYIDSEAKQYLIDNDGGEDFEFYRKRVTTEKFPIVGCDENARQALLAFAGVESNTTEKSATAPEKDYGTDVFELHGDGRIKWFYYNEDGNEGNGQYVENVFGLAEVREASKETTVEGFFDKLGELAKQYYIDNDGSAEFETLHKRITTDKHNLVGCNENTRQALLAFAGVTTNGGVKSEVHEDKFFVVPETGHVEWIRKAKDSSKFFTALFYVQRLDVVSNTDLPATEYFKQLAKAIMQDKTIISATLSEGDSEYELVRNRYYNGEYTVVGANDQTKCYLAALADGFKLKATKNASKFFLVGERLVAQGYVVLWLARSEEECKVRYDITYMRKDSILKAAEKNLNFVEFFDEDIHEYSGCLYAGDDNFDRVDELYKTEPKWEGVSEETMRSIINHVQEAFKSPTNDLSAKSDNLPDPETLAAMKALNEELKAASEAYYGDGDSPLSDLEYDAKFDELLALEQKTGYILPDSVTQGVGADVVSKLPKVTHPEKVLSLDKTKDVAVLAGLLRQDPDGDVGVLSWKMDGLTILATYEGGVLKQAVTRGNGKVGEDVTHNAKYFKGMPRRIPYKGELRVRGEAVVSFSTFERINAELPEGQEPYKNPRNLVSGMVRRLEVTKDGSVEFFPFAVSIADPKYATSSYAQSLKFLAGQGFNPVYHITCTAATMGEAVESFKKKVTEFDYPTDGLVLAIDNLSVQEKLGATSHHPRGALAFKWADEKKKTILREIEWSASRTGVLTPVAIFDPVELEGTSVKRASVHNLTQLRKLKLGIGDEISVYKANMIIPQIAENHTKSDTIQHPATCPVCGGATSIRIDTKSKTKEPSEFVICTNPACTAKNIKGLAHFVKREAMNIEGISEKTIEELVSAGYIRSALDFYTLKDHPEIAERPNWGKASYNKMIYAIDTSRFTTFPQLIYALGIKNVGRSASEAIAKFFNSAEAAKYLGAEEYAGNGVKLFMDVMTNTDNPSLADTLLAKIEGIGQTMRADIIAYFKDNKEFVQKLVSLLTIDSTGSSRKAVVLPSNIPQGAPGCLNGLVFCVTGKVEFPGARDALASYIESLGGRFATSVTKNTNYLITNTPDSGSTKNRKAQELGCKVISEQAFFVLVKELSEKVSQQ